MRDSRQSGMQVIPAVVGDGDQPRIDGGVPPCVGHRSRANIGVLSVVGRLDDPPRFRRGNDEARRVESWLRVAAPLRNEVAHDVEEAALRSKLRMRETLDIVDGAIVERDRDLGPGVVRSVLAGSEEPIGQRPERDDLASGIGHELQVRRKRDMVVASVVAPDDVVRVIRKHESFHRLSLDWRGQREDGPTTIFASPAGVATAAACSRSVRSSSPMLLASTRLRP